MEGWWSGKTSSSIHQICFDDEDEDEDDDEDDDDDDDEEDGDWWWLMVMMMTEDLPAVNSWVFQRFSSWLGKASTNIHGSKYSLGKNGNTNLDMVRWLKQKYRYTPWN